MSAPRFTVPAGLPRLLTVAEVAALSSLSVWTVRGLVRDGELKARRSGRALRILDLDYAEWVGGLPVTVDTDELGDELDPDQTDAGL